MSGTRRAPLPATCGAASDRREVDIVEIGLHACDELAVVLGCRLTPNDGRGRSVAARTVQDAWPPHPHVPYAGPRGSRTAAVDRYSRLTGTGRHDAVDEVDVVRQLRQTEATLLRHPNKSGNDRRRLSQYLIPVPTRSRRSSNQPLRPVRTSDGQPACLVATWARLGAMTRHSPNRSKATRPSDHRRPTSAGCPTVRGGRS